MTLVNEFQPLTKVKKNSLFYVAGVQIPFCRHCEIRKDSQNIGKVLAKILKMSIFSEMELASPVMKKHASFPLRFVLYFKN